jgi:hypothetical protein
MPRVHDAEHGHTTRNNATEGLGCLLLDHDRHDRHDNCRPLDAMSDVQDSVAFVVAFPLPFRVLFLVGLGVFGWAANLHGLHALGIEAVQIFDLRLTNADDSHSHTAHHVGRSPRPPPEPASVYQPIYRLAFFYTAFCFAAWTLYHLATRGNPDSADLYKFIPSLCALALFAMSLAPYKILAKAHRDSFVQCVSCFLQAKCAYRFLAR